MTVYAKIENNKLICASNNMGITGLADSPTLCEASGFTAYTEEEISGYFAGTHQIIDGILLDISNTPEYIKKTRLIEIETELKQVDIAYATILETPVEYTNGFFYQPKHIQTYAILIASNTSPQDIWDYTELNVVNMTNAQLKALTTFLSVIAEPAFQARKIARKALLEEKLLLQS